MTWLQEAACGDGIDPDVFCPDEDFDTPEEFETKVRIAKDVCSRCPVVAECLELGMRPENIRWFIFGGLSAKERRQLERDRNAGQR